MSLDNDTPIKAAPSSLRRRLASKSMHDLAGPGGFISTPSRAISSGDSSPMSITRDFGRRSESVNSPTKRSLPPLEVRDPPKSPSPRPPTSAQLPPAVAPRAQTAPSVLPPSAAPHNPYDDDVPSPFLKKMDGSRFPSASNLPTKSATVSGRPSGPLAAARGTRQSLGSKPTMGSRLLAARAQAAAGVDEVGRRISTATAGHLRGKSMAS
ncbi:hypothetical protein BCR35DRAFT_40232 [Leucosporidium creatinivorum]|uniref:Uncharacterized protein n=1 Tax=Leucosporidium creatinivorum TaxID=106004 RepID=A0A1Y2FW36_9BASI|nr:hypothetical protein BCR35DRAFT_40232 [Leucosporidium creatinivorum]